jgi:hypothetical protein
VARCSICSCLWYKSHKNIILIELYVKDLVESAATDVTEIVGQHQESFDYNIQMQMEHASDFYLIF